MTEGRSSRLSQVLRVSVSLKSLRNLRLSGIAYHRHLLRDPCEKNKSLARLAASLARELTTD